MQLQKCLACTSAATRWYNYKCSHHVVIFEFGNLKCLIISVLVVEAINAIRTKIKENGLVVAKIT